MFSFLRWVGLLKSPEVATGRTGQPLLRGDVERHKLGGEQHSQRSVLSTLGAR